MDDLNSLAPDMPGKPELASKGTWPVKTVRFVFGDGRSDRFGLGQECPFPAHARNLNIEPGSIEAARNVNELPFRAANSKMRNELQRSYSAVWHICHTL